MRPPLASRQHAQSVSEYEQAIQLESGDGYLHFLHGTALFNAQRYESAYTALQQSVLLEPQVQMMKRAVQSFMIEWTIQTEPASTTWVFWRSLPCS